MTFFTPQRDISHTIRLTLVLCLLFSLSIPYVNACNTVTADSLISTSQNNDNHCHNTDAPGANQPVKTDIKCDFLSCDNCCAKCFQSSYNSFISIKRSAYDVVLAHSEALSDHQLTIYLSHLSTPPTPPPTC